MTEKIICNDCGWTGTEADLVDRVTRNGSDECRCPKCGTFEELEEESKPECYDCGETEGKLIKFLDRHFCWICYNEYGKEG